jgi:hypothetical protein
VIATRAAVPLACVLAVVPASARPVEHPDFTENLNRPVLWLLLPPESSITRGRVTDAEPLIQETLALEEALSASMVRQLGALGYQVDALSASVEAQAGDEQLRELAADATDLALEALAKASHDPNGVAEGRFTIGDGALALGARTGAEGLIVLRSESLIASKGSKALSGIMNPFNLLSATRTRTQLIGGLYDARDGQLLAMIVGRDVGGVVKHPDEVGREVVESALRGFPPRGSGRAAKAKWRRQAPPRDVDPLPEPEELDVEDVLAAFESVAGETPEAEPSVASEAVATPAAKDADETAAGDAATEPEGSDVGAEVDPLEELLRLHDTLPRDRPEPELQVAFLGDVGETSLVVALMAPRAVRISIDRGEFQLLEPGGRLELAVSPGSHGLLVADAERPRELVRAVLVVVEGRRAIAELWPRGD